MLRFLVNLGLSFFLLVTVPIVYIYFFQLYSKFANPRIKNLNAKEFIWAGMIVMVLVAIDLLIVRRFIKSMKQKL